MIGPSAVGIALVLAQIEVDAAVEGAAEGEVGKPCPVVFAGGVEGQRALADANLGLRCGRLVHQVDLGLAGFGKGRQRRRWHGSALPLLEHGQLLPHRLAIEVAHGHHAGHRWRIVGLIEGADVVDGQRSDGGDGADVRMRDGIVVAEEQLPEHHVGRDGRFLSTRLDALQGLRLKTGEVGGIELWPRELLCQNSERFVQILGQRTNVGDCVVVTGDEGDR